MGEFDQKGTVRTKYGFKDDYLQAIQALKDAGIQPIADVVLNHKAAADGLEEIEVVEVDPMDRNKVLWALHHSRMDKFTFDGQNGAYNDFHWHWYHFTGTDYDASRIRMESTKSKGTTKVGLMEIW